MLIQLRSGNAEYMAYHLASIGGKLEHGIDKNSYETALREFEEETGAIFPKSTRLTKFD